MTIKPSFAQRILVSAALLLQTLFSPHAGRACAPVPRPGQFVKIAEESALIVWDEATRTQHFIRRATFETDAPDFGFLVPTPTTPALAEVSELAFTNLEYLIRPKEIERTEFSGFDFTPFLFGFGYFLYLSPNLSPKERAPTIAGVRVLSAQRVAGYDAVVLEANDAAELNRWLGKHGYAANPALTEWLTPYVAARWRLTAFKIAKDADYRAVGSAAVRLSFKTERPFFPYREPADQREAKEAQGGARLLRVFCLSTARWAGTLGAAGHAWPGRTVWADRLAEADRESFRAFLPPDSQLPPDAWLTVFEDDSAPRPGTDEVYFAPAAVQGIVQPPPVVKTVGQTIPVPLDLVLLLLGGLVFWLRRRERRKSAA